jgi:D-alanyl-D-alanine carboxypeptidase
VNFVPTLRIQALVAALAAIIATTASPAHARTEALLLIEADTGKVLHAENATMPWYPASITKLMTTYVTLQAVRNKRITLDTLFTFSPRASSQAPSKIGLKPGTQITVDNAIKILMVKSANDVAVVLAEGVSGSVESFASEMNLASKNLGMTQTNWVNPNGLPADEQITSARDLAIMARALLRDFPEYDMYWNIPAVQFGKKYMRNYNTLIGRYEGADGMKTGFICASGFNLVASATRNGKRLIAVVLGSPSSPYRGAKAAGLLERGFHRGPLSWLSPALGSVEQLQPVNTAPPDLRDEMCGPHRKRPAAEEADENPEPSAFMMTNLPPGNGKASALLKDRPDAMKAITVFVGAAKNAADSQFAKARDKIKKLAKGTKAPVQAATTATVATPALQTLSSPPAGGFAPVVGQPERAARRLPAATDVNNPSALSYAPTAKPEIAPLMATPDAKPAVAAKPKAAAKTATKPAEPKSAAAKPATAATAKPKAKVDAKPDTKPGAQAKPTGTVKQTAAAKPAAKPAAPTQGATASAQAPKQQ